MRRRTLAAAAAVLGVFLGGASGVRAQDDDAPAITARVHGTFVDQRGGGGVLSGDMYIARFAVRNGGVIAIGRVAGSLADSQGVLLGLVDQELELPASNVESTCNQLRMDLGATDADVLQTRVRVDPGAAGFDSRDGAKPKALGVLCATGELLRRSPAPADVVKALEAVVTALKAQGRQGTGGPRPSTPSGGRETARHDTSPTDVPCRLCRTAGVGVAAGGR